MRNFGHKKWSPDGSRPHVWIRSEFDSLAAQIVDGPLRTGSSSPLDDWYPGWREIVVPAWEQHLTLAWVDIPTRDTSRFPTALAHRAASGLWSALEEFPPATLTATGVVASAHGVQLQIERTPELTQLAATAVAELLGVYGLSATVHGAEDDWTPHITLAHGVADVDTPTGPVPLPADLRIPPQDVRKVVVIDHDTWPDPTAGLGPLWDDLEIPVDHTRFRQRNAGRGPTPPWNGITSGLLGRT
ncbi:2'-5' RNA ligase family protein [Nocardia cyriacigeorgica]|uniref:2'-5' RNA ligase family protein n=1 Tax=Nocardia cyriacigeorgica TaxID=135487 RepID=UPI00245771B9|nr:2'-5' RNA ligase family protein [Nocardia cyriacigeorgica]